MLYIGAVFFFFFFLSIGSPVTLLPRLVARSCLRVIAIIIITRVGEPSRTIDLLGSSFLIHVETFKGVNSAMGKPWNVFSGFRTCFVRVWMPPMAILCLRKATRVFWPMTCMRKVKHVCAWSKPMYTCTCIWAQSWRLNQIPCPIWIMVPPPKFLHDCYDLEDYSRHTQAQIFKHEWKEKSKTIYKYPHEL